MEARARKRLELGSYGERPKTVDEADTITPHPTLTVSLVALDKSDLRVRYQLMHFRINVADSKAGTGTIMAHILTSMSSLTWEFIEEIAWWGAVQKRLGTCRILSS